MVNYHRRDFLKMGLGVLVGSALPLQVLASPLQHSVPPRSLALYNIHTDERVKITYFAKGRYLPQALKEINHLLRDHRNGEIYPIHTELLDLLHAINGYLPRPEFFNVISGYRSPETNEKLRRNTNGVAKRSYHMRGKAIDIRIPGFDTSQLRKLCVKLRRGGVGYYRNSDFVHVDIGPVRMW